MNAAGRQRYYSLVLAVFCLRYNTFFARAGCTYLQLDEVYLAYLCDPRQHEELRARGVEVAHEVWG
jgi:5-methyltetrahydropteroyltriglutamate--homocysteine methyltransferase